MPPRIRNAFCFTLNNYTQPEYDDLCAFPHTYIVIGKERAPNTDTPHLQGYVRFAARPSKSLSSLRARFPRCHWEVAISDSQSNFVYCSKGGDFYEHGERDGGVVAAEGRRRGGETTLAKYELARTNAQAGKFAEIPADLFLRHYSAIRAIHRDFRVAPPPVIVSSTTGSTESPVPARLAVRGLAFRAPSPNSVTSGGTGTKKRRRS